MPTRAFKMESSSTGGLGDWGNTENDMDENPVWLNVSRLHQGGLVYVHIRASSVVSWSHSEHIRGKKC